MPVAHILNNLTPQATKLSDRLVAEWKDPQNHGEPILIEEESTRLSKSLHLFVIWSEWGNLSQRERSEIILDAYGRTHEVGRVLDVTVSMGLTAEEASGLGIQYELESKLNQ